MKILSNKCFVYLIIRSTEWDLGGGGRNGRTVFFCSKFLNVFRDPLNFWMGFGKGCVQNLIAFNGGVSEFWQVPLPIINERSLSHTMLAYLENHMITIYTGSSYQYVNRTRETFWFVYK